MSAWKEYQLTGSRESEMEFAYECRKEAKYDRKKHEEEMKNKETENKEC